MLKLIAVIVVLVFFVFLIAGVVVFIWPSLINSRLKKPLSRLDIFSRYIAGSVVLFVLASVAISFEDDEAKAAAAKPAVVDVSKPEVKPLVQAPTPPVVAADTDPNLGMTLDEYKKQINAKVYANQIDNLHLITTLEISNQSFTIDYTKGILLTGTLNTDNGRMEDMSIIVAGGEGAASNVLTAILLMSFSQQVLDPGVDKTKLGKKLGSTFDKLAEEMKAGNANEKFKMGKLEYKINFITDVGLFFNISPAT